MTQFRKHPHIWGYNGVYPIAQIKNAAIEDVAYTSFESSENGGWTYSGNPSSSTYKTGRMSYILSGGPVTKAGLVAGRSYVLTYVIKGNTPLTISGTRTGYPLILFTKGGWTCFKHLISGVSSVSVSGSAVIDELRLYPEVAEMTSFTYNPFVGMTSLTDTKGMTTYYEYDNFNRLYQVRDHNDRILKRYNYYYSK